MLVEAPAAAAVPPSGVRGHELFRRLPQLTDKAIVDLVNGLVVAKDHVDEQRAPQGRLWGLLNRLTGENARRQGVINASLLSQVELGFLYLKDLEVTQTRSLLAVEGVARHVGALAQHVSELGDALVDLEDEVDAIKREVEVCRKDLRRVDMEQSATRDVTAIFDHWDAGQWEGCSPLERVFLALDALYWGPVGDFARAHAARKEQYLSIARNKLTARLRNELEADVSRPVPLSLWCEPGRRSALLADAIGYLASTEDVAQPLCQVIASPSVAATMPRVPQVMSIDRAVDRAVDEVFARRRA